MGLKDGILKTTLYLKRCMFMYNPYATYMYKQYNVYVRTKDA